MELKICHLYPDLLNLCGDRGNLITLAQRCAKRGISVSMQEAPLGERVDFATFDLLFLGGGMEDMPDVLLDELHAWRGAEICAAIEDGKATLAIGSGYQLLGRTYKTADGAERDYIGALDFHSIAQAERVVGDYMFQWDELGEPVKIVGFENHSAKTFLGSGVRPFGTVRSGYGNNGEDKTEGARYHNVVGTYCHGSLLPKNPKLADWLIQLALERKFGTVTLSPIDDTLEERAHGFLVQRLST